MTDRAAPDPWHALRRLTPARIALGRSGPALPTAEVLRFGLAHAQARDAVNFALDVAGLQDELRTRHDSSLVVHSRTPDRAAYLLRPDLGRRLDDVSAALLAKAVAPASGACTLPDVAFVLADGLSALAVQRHAPALLDALVPRLPPDWTIAPIVIAEQARVALGDEIGEILGARLVAVLIGERPGLSSPDSLSVYLSWAPQRGCSDAERNCVSNIRPEGLGYAAAAMRIAWLMREARRLQRTGVELKDRSDLPEIAEDSATSE
ncbi:MAG: ethanolamine ammonia-lyase subunit EutC [Aromatoleum sp.]|jgi:ethanolamine ammonia-lyase small subunit|uniref:ethanolamine ammonia-lyase subunit EutC n=1 Tax=Aromatoleum sp. TaxID=2307007 RepID=UPI002893CB3E|nr:ethanolamine ammonia-lyase subunit EutC [Aromatoleum sp.]MDT3669375.1 ethanolamine ammonia-lyase subunit EutC [Aromatoleum sp.]